MITSERLTKEINKVLPSYSSLPTGIAYESVQEERTSYVRLSNVSSQRSFLQLVETVETKLKKSPYVDNFLIAYSRDLSGKPKLEGFYVCAWSNPAQYQLALKVELTLKMQELLNIQKQVLAKKKDIIETSKVMLENKKLMDN